MSLWACPAIKRLHPLRAKIPGIALAHTYRHLERARCLLYVPTHDQARPATAPPPFAETPFRPVVRRFQEWTGPQPLRCEHQDPRIARQVDAPVAYRR